MTTDSSTRRDVMHWYWDLLGGHAHVRVFMNGGKCGDLVFREDEFNKLHAGVSEVFSTGMTDIVFIMEDRECPSITCPRCGRVSFNAGDIEHRYCGNCHQFHDLK